jgi:hypothetical protein
MRIIKKGPMMVAKVHLHFKAVGYKPKQKIGDKKERECVCESAGLGIVSCLNWY